MNWRYVHAAGAALMAAAGIIQASSQLFGPTYAGYVILACGVVEGGIIAFEQAMKGDAAS